MSSPDDQIKANIKALKAGDELPIASSSKSSLALNASSAAVLAHADEVESVVLRAEPGGARDRGRGRGHRALEPRRRGDVLDAVRTTRR